MSTSLQPVLRVAFAAIALTGGAVMCPIYAEPAAEHFLSGVEVAERNACAVVRIEFNSRVQYLSHSPPANGDELHVVLKPIDQGEAARSVVVDEESLHAPGNERASVHAIELGLNAAGAELMVYFKRSVAYKVAPGADAKSILIAVSGSEASAECIPVFRDADVALADSAQRSMVPSQGEPKSAAQAMDITPEALAAFMKEARTALPKGNVDRTIELLTTVLAATDKRYAQEARELLGVAYETKGLMVDAGAIYQDYLALYPKGPGTDRVRARLIEMDKSGQTVFAQLKKSQADASMPIPPPIGNGDKKSIIDVNASTSAATLGQREEKKDPYSWTVTHNGSIGLSYNRNQGGRDFFIPPRLQLGWDKENVYQVYQNSVFGSLDYEGRFDNAEFTGRFHVSAYQDNRYISGQNDETAVSALYFDGKSKDSGVSGRIGRQSRFSDGILGRFDGALVSYQAQKDVKLNAVTGSPVERSRDRPFLYDSYFNGVSAEFENVSKGVDTSLFFVDQRTDGMLDRQGVGGEVHYTDEMMSAFCVIDYDIHYLELNNAIVTGTYIFPDFSSIGINFDYRRAPLIFTSNALQGQGVATLSELLKIYTHDDIERFSLDRTARSYSAGGNFSHPLNEHLLLSGDATLTYMSGTKASGNVPAMDSTGTDFYGAVQLTDSDVLTEGDSYTGGVRFADTQSSYRYMLEGTARYPITKDWRIGPVLRLGYVDIKADGNAEYDIMPSLRTSYYVTEDIVLDFEIGKKWTERETIHGIENETELTVLSGVRYDFNTDR